MSIESQLTLHDISVVDVQFKKSEKIDFKVWNEIEENTLQLSVDPEFALKEQDIHNGRLALTVSLFDVDYEEQEHPLFIKVVIHGYFEDMNKDNELDIFNLYAVNMVSMIYPYARSFISSLTATSGMEAINIPTINVLELFSQKFNDSKEDINSGD